MPNREACRFRVAFLGIAFASLALSTAATAQPLRLIGQNRSVLARVEHGAGVVQDRRAAPDTDPFNDCAGASYNSTISPGLFTSTACQASTITQTPDSLHVHAEGLTKTRNSFMVIETVQQDVQVVLLVTFNTTQPLNYDLQGDLQGFWDVGGNIHNHGNYKLRFGPVGTLPAIFELGGTIPPTDNDGYPLLDKQFNLSGTLPPGTYELRLIQADVYASIANPQNPDFGGGGDFEFSLDLKVQP